ncbi:Hydrocephalus-inducing protein like protein, related [Eimeria praecox]|uniref:Hydrocephalus-inducing protein like protein, related n=1 Tax=Eimeria praecox TaxID=51316 RepID=U6H3Y5_9EIME|nr:Hydrocephalus-inducing protein like protein, related [Eimeria praecox]
MFNEHTKHWYLLQVTFRAGDKKTYSYDLQIETERETFLVPLRAFQGLCSVSLPPVISLDGAIVGKRKEKTVLLSNDGDAASHVTLVIFAIESPRCGTFDAQLEIRYDDGRVEVKPVQGTVVEGPVTLSTSILKFDTTFVNLTCEKTVCIENNTSEHLPFWWSLGPGPQVKFTRGELDFGDVVVYTEKTLDVEIVNTGDIAASYSVKPLTGAFPPGTEVKFSPSSGCICINKAERVQASFRPAFVGDFEVTVLWAIEASPEDIALKLKGRAVPPQIDYDVPSINFGVIPFGFEEVRSVQLTNTSDAPQTVEVKVLKRLDDTYGDISVNPHVLTIPAGASEKVDVVLCPSKAQAYIEEIAFGLPGLIDEYFILPLRGSSKTPQVALEPEGTLVFDDVFINTTAKKAFMIRNTSRLSAQFSVTLEQGGDQVSAEVSPSEGLVSPLSAVAVSIILHPLSPGDVRITCWVSIAGLDNPFQLEVSACVSGPKLKIEPKELQWGKIKCLDEVAQQAELTNVSPIPALIRCCVRSKHGYFAVQNPEMILEGGASAPVHVVATFLEAVASTGQLIVSAVDGQSLMVYLKGQAVGSPVVLEDFGSCTDFEQVVIEALSSLPGRASQVIVCQESFGPGTTPVRIARTLATADFFTPNLVATPSSLAFKGSLEISFKEHPRVDVMSLEGETEFPNVELETTMLDFGFIVNETTKRIPIRMRNTGCVPVTYSWFLTDTYSIKGLKGAENNESMNSEGAGVPIHKIFDFTPFTGMIEPGACETVHVRFWGVPNREVSAVALCSIGHGPEYPVRLVGRASSPRLKVSQTEFDFGELPYLKPVTAEGYRRRLLNRFLWKLTTATRLLLRFVEKEHTAVFSSVSRERLKTAVAKNQVATSTSRYNAEPCTVDTLNSEKDEKETPLRSSSSSLSSAYFANWRLPGEETSFVATPGKYILDFGSVVVGQSKTRVVQLRNSSPQTFGVKINKKDLQGTGFHVEPDAIGRLHPNEQATIAVTAKQDKEGDANVLLTAFVSGSLSYQISLKGKFVVPDLHFYTDTLDFGSIKRGLCKTLTLRLRNEKSVPAQWRYRGLVDKGDKAQRDALRCFTVEPRQSVVEPGEWVDLKVQFFPERAEKEICARLIFCIEDNPKWKCITAVGAPKLPRLEFVPSFVDFGYSLPSHVLRQDVIVRNNSDEPYEIYSLEFDDLHKQTDGLLRDYDGFDESGIALLPVRPPGKSCWSRVRKAALRKALVDGSIPTDSEGSAVKTEAPNSARGKMQNVMSEPGQQEQQIVESSSDESADESPQEFPYRVLPPCRQSAIVLGPICSGKRSVAAHIGGDSRRHLTLDECVEWAIAASGKKKKLESAGVENARLVEELIKLVEAQEGEGEANGGKKSGKAKTGKGDRRTEVTNPGLPLHLLAAAVKLRTAQPDCFAGTVFRVEPSSYCASLADGALSIVRGLRNEDIMIAVIKFGQPDSSHREGESSPNPLTEGVAFYRGLLAKQLQREREIMEQLDSGKGSESVSKAAASAMQSDLKRRKPPSAVEGESHPTAVPVADGNIESLKHELQLLQQSRQRFESYVSTTRLAQSFVQDQVAAYSSAETELLKELKTEMEQPPLPSSPCNGSRRSSHRTSLGFQRLITFSTAYANSSQPIETLLAQVQRLREPIIPNEPPVPPPKFLEVVHYPSSSPALEPPAKFFLFAPLPTIPLEKAEEDETKNRAKKPKDAASNVTTRSKTKQERGGEEESLAAKLTAEPGFTKASRWTLQPQTEQRLLLKCYVDEEGELACTLHFSVVGDPHTFRLGAKATCCVPRLLNFPEGCFENAVQERPAQSAIKRTYIGSEDIFDWGPLLAGRSIANVKSLYSKVSSIEDVDLVTIPAELCDFMTPLTLQNGSPFTVTVKGNFAGTTGTEGRRPPKGQTGDPTFLLFPSEVTLVENATARLHLCRTVLIENPTPFEVRWNFTTQEVPSKSFSFEPEQGGILDAFGSQPLNIVYEAPVKPSTAQCRLTFRCTDAEGISNCSEVKIMQSEQRRPSPATLKFLQSPASSCSANQEIPLIVYAGSVSAEAFSIDAGIELPSKTRVLEFGKVQAYQEAEIPYTVFNRGKYPIHFDIDSLRLRNLLALSPQSGEVKPGEQRKGVARISARHEVELTGTEELAVTIKDVESGCSIEPPQQPLQVMAIVAFNEVSLSPPRGLNFGPVESGKTSLLSFELENKGRFSFDWYLVNQECMFTAPEEPARGAETVQKGEKQKTGKAKLQGKSPEKSLGATFGPFKVVPVRGQLDPGTKASVQVEYCAQGDASHSISLALLVNGVRMGHGDEISVSSVGPIPAFFADPTAPIDFETHGPIKPAATYFIQGQSSVPCISLEPEKLFHEQALAISMDEAYAMWQKRSGTIFVQEENCLCFGPVIAGSPGSASGVVEMIRIDNPQLIPAEIIFEIKQAPRGPHDKNQQTAEDSAFDVQPKRIVVAPHDYAHATVSFKPTALQQYSSSLRIAVEKSANPLTGQAQFDLRGEGTLPSITLAFPASVSQKDAKPKSHLPYFDFGRVAVSRTMTIPVVLKNEGIIPATARVQLPPCDSIDFDLPHSVTLKPKEEQIFSLAYRPRTPGELDYKFRTTTHANPFENVEIHIKGCAFSEELIWSAVNPANQCGLRTSDGELVDGNHFMFDDIPLGKTVTHGLTLRNISAQAISFELNTESLGQLKDRLTFTPAAGILAPNTAHTVNLSFKTEEPISVTRHPINFNALFSQGSENSLTPSKAPLKSKGRTKNKPADAKSDTAATGKGDAQSPEELILYISVASDVRQCEVGIERIDFESTSLFKSRLFSFTVTNTSSVSLPYEIFFEKANERDDPCFYKVAPCRGRISSGGQQIVQITFSPKDMADFDRTLVFSFPNLGSGSSRVSIPVTATAIRPICHLEIPPTDYLERRSQSFVLPLADNIAVLEIEGVGVGVRHTRRIHVHNPTACDIDFECEPAHASNEIAAASATADMSVQPFKCLTRRGRVPACKKAELVFEYTAAQLGVSERLWTFSIPSKELEQTLLLVGRATEPYVSLETSRVNFSPTMVGRTVEEIVLLHNKESIPVSFQFDRITQKFRNLRLDIKGEGYYLMPSLKLVEEEVERVLEGDSESFDFGCVLAGQRYIPKGQVFDCIAVFAPVASTSVQSLQATCEVQGKKICKLLLTGSSTSPKVSFSFTTHEFGALFVPQAADVPFDALSVKPRIASRAVLKITNTDVHHQCSISSPFSPTEGFDFQPIQVSLSPEEVLEIPITFSPRETKLYKAKIPFFVGDQLAATLQLSGKGIPIRLEAQAIEGGVVKLQPVLRGKGSSQSIRIINHSEKPISFYLKSPDGELSIHGPQAVPVFLCNISGKCFETELRLRPPSVAFGQVVVGSWMSQDVLLSNIGELPMAFRFSNSESHPGLISISPSHGTLQPRANQPVTVSFRPIKPTEQLEIDDIICFGHAICGPKEPHTEVARLNFTVTGQSVPLPADALHVLKFATSVRSPVTKTFFLKNPKKVEWTTTPSISLESPKDGNYFSCQPAGPITIPPQQKVALELTYHPMTMTVEAGSQEQSSAKGTRRTLPSQHTATLFCALPAGEACCIRMIGTASEPTVEQTVETVATCKQQTTVNIKIRNWLETRQAFNAGFTILQPSGGQGIQIQATGVLDVLMRATAPGSGETSVMLTSEELGLFKYLVKYDMRNPGIEKRITCSAPLGREAQQLVRFTHFGKKATTYQLSLEWATDSLGPQKASALPEIFFLESKGIQVPADTDGQGIEMCIPVKFVPCRLQDTKAILCARGPEGQEYRALLVGRTTPPEAQGPLKVPKGKGLAIEFKNPLEAATEFTAQVDQAAFALDKKTFRLEPRKSTTITVALKSEARATGRLIISAEAVPKWIIYLKTD